MMKYIKFEHIGIVVFEEHVGHAEMADKVGLKPLSAGSVFCDDINPPRCGGESYRGMLGP